MNQSNMYKINLDILEGRISPIPAEGTPIPAEGNTTYPQRVSNPLMNPLKNHVDNNNFPEENLPRLNKSANANLPFPQFGNEFGACYQSLEEYQQQVIKDCYMQFHELAQELKYINHTWNPSAGLELLAQNYERLIEFYEDDTSQFGEMIRRRYEYRRIEQHQKRVSLAWLIWDNDHDATGMDLVETVLTEGDYEEPDYE